MEYSKAGKVASEKPTKIDSLSIVSNLQNLLFFPLPIVANLSKTLRGAFCFVERKVEHAIRRVSKGHMID